MTRRSFGSRKCFFIVALLLVIFLAAPVLAADGDGTGGGDEPLTLESSSIADGTAGVDIATDRITLTFSKNVVNMTVKDNNAACFAITADGAAVPFTVEMADDQLYRELRRDIVLRFSAELRPAAAYSVTVSPNLMSKSGVYLGEEVTVKFTTAGNIITAAPDQPVVDSSEKAAGEEDHSQITPDLEKEAEVIIDQEASDTEDILVSTEGETAAEEATGGTIEDKNASESAGGNNIPIILAITAIIIMAAYILIRKKQKN